jgi:hypothetical protein
MGLNFSNTHITPEAIWITPVFTYLHYVNIVF